MSFSRLNDEGRDCPKEWAYFDFSNFKNTCIKGPEIAWTK